MGSLDLLIQKSCEPLLTGDSKSLVPFAIITGDFVRTGGMDRANFALADYLARQGREVHLVAHRVDPILLQYPTVTFHQVTKIANSYFLSDPLLRRKGYLVARRIAARGGRVVVNGGNCAFPDVNWVHYVHCGTPHFPVRGITRKVWNGYRRWLNIFQERQALQRAKLIIANSEQTKTLLVQQLGLSPERIRIVYLTADGHLFRPAKTEEKTNIRRALGWTQDKLILAFVGAPQSERKNFATVVRALKTLSSLPGPSVELAVIGGTGEPSQLDLPPSGSVKVTFLGLRKDIAEILRACDALVAPVRYESYGLGIHEALCCAIPAFVSASAGVAERYPPALSDLLLPNSDDDVDLSERLQRWRQDPLRHAVSLHELSESLRSRSWDHVASEMISHIEHGR